MKLLNNSVEEIDSDEEERILVCAAAVDVAKASGMVCVRHPHASIEGRSTSKVWEVDSTTNSILALGSDLVALGWRGLCWSPRRTTGGRSSTCWRRRGWSCGS